MMSNVFTRNVVAVEIVSLGFSKTKMLFCEEESKKPLLYHYKNISFPIKKDSGPAKGKLIVYYE